MAGLDALETIREYLRAGGWLMLFLDYDGTLVPIARTPEEAQPDRPLLALLTELATQVRIDPIILSGRPLASLQAMLPVPGLTLAGTYGLEIYRNGRITKRCADLTRIRPVIEQVRSAWKRSIAEYRGFLLEDKGLAVALHARWAEVSEVDQVLDAARTAATALLPSQEFRMLGGDRFLEVAPSTAHKGLSVEWLLNRRRDYRAMPVYFGDDDKDEEAFGRIRRWGGIPIGIGTRFPLNQALERLPSPEALRVWLRSFLNDTA